MKDRIHSIDALRGIAALGVSAFYHFRYLTGDLTFNHPALAPLGFVPPMRWLYESGDGLVDLFFVLSGFIFCVVYRPRSEPIGIRPRTFFVFRMARLYPLLLLTTVIAGGVMLLSSRLYGSTYGGDEVSWSEAAKHLLFLKQGMVKGSLNAPAWSLSVEVSCYLLFYIIARRTERIFITASVLAVLLGLLALQNVVSFPMEDWWLPRGLVGFFTGCLLHRAMPLLNRLPTPLLTGCAIIGLFLAISEHWPFRHVSSFARLSLLAWPFVIALALRSTPSMLLAWKPFSVLGDLSYSIYLWHLPVAATILLLHGQRPFEPAQWSEIMLLNTALMLMVGYLSFRFIETPARLYLRRYAGPRRPIEPPLTSGAIQA